MRKPVTPALNLRIPYLIALVVVALAVVLVISGFVWAKKGVTVTVDGVTAFHTTAEATTVSEVLSEVGVVLAEGDLVTPALEDTIADGSEIVVRHAVQVTLDCNGQAFEMFVVGSTVADALVAAGLDPTLGLHVSPSVAAPLWSGMTITATDIFLRIVQEEAELPFATVEQEDPTAAAGSRTLVQEGRPGTALRVWEVVVMGGTEGARRLKAETVLTEPVDAVFTVGTRPAPKKSSPPPGATASAKAPTSGSKLTVLSTAYTPWDPGCGGISVITRKLSRYNIPSGWGIIAVDPSVIPFGTKVYVPGYGYAVAADSGGAINGAKIDVCFWSGGESAAKTAARSWGRRTVTITIVD
jgi:uncharacterized protein YabE (DUF348 family)